MEQEKMRKLFDFRELAVPEQLFELSYSKDAVEREVEAIREKFLTIEPISGPVKSGDIVVLELPATEVEDVGTLQINVGKYFYDNALEDSLVGLLPGTVVMLPQRNQGRSGTLVQIKRRIFPPLTDELAERLGLEGVKTLNDYREVVKEKHIARDKQKKSNAIMGMVFREVIAKSEFGNLAAEITAATEDYKVQLHAMAEKNGITYEELLEKYIPPKYETEDQRDSYIREVMETHVKQGVIGTYVFCRDGKVLNQSGFEAFKKSYLDAGMDRNQVEQQFTYQVYCDTAPVEYYQELVMAYYENQFKAVEKP